MTAHTLAALEVFQTHRNWLEPWKVAKLAGLTSRQCGPALRDLHGLALIERRGQRTNDRQYRLSAALS